MIYALIKRHSHIARSSRNSFALPISLFNGPKFPYQRADGKAGRGRWSNAANRQSRNTSPSSGRMRLAVGLARCTVGNFSRSGRTCTGSFSREAVPPTSVRLLLRVLCRGECAGNSDSPASAIKSLPCFFLRHLVVTGRGWGVQPKDLYTCLPSQW